MNKNKPYFELLQDPRWQKMRLEVMQKADFACEDCGNEEETLNVHHTYYQKGKAPWEYPKESLKVYCKSCHQKHQDIDKEIKKRVGDLSLYDKQNILGHLLSCEYYKNIDNDGTLNYPFNLDGDETILGFAKNLELDPSEIYYKMIENPPINILTFEEISWLMKKKRDDKKISVGRPNKERIEDRRVYG
ncbi:MAG: hypothetical protein KJ578_15740 [Bacteroidetes bacterium]|nr:hypothetical protein [Bacteroidota bacterium]